MGTITADQGVNKPPLMGNILQRKSRKANPMKEVWTCARLQIDQQSQEARAESLGQRSTPFSSLISSLACASIKDRTSLVCLLILISWTNCIVTPSLKIWKNSGNDNFFSLKHSCFYLVLEGGFVPLRAKAQIWDSTNRIDHCHAEVPQTGTSCFPSSPVWFPILAVRSPLYGSLCSCFNSCRHWPERECTQIANIVL